MLSRIKTWVSGEVLKSSDLNGEFNNILANPISLVSPTTDNIDFAANQALTFVVEKLSSDPGSAQAGRLYFNTATTQIFLGNGTSYALVGPQSGAAPTAVGSRVMGLQGTLSTNLGVFTAQEYVLRTTNPLSGSFILQSTATVTINTRTAGPVQNGRDQAGAFASTFVHWYVVSTGASSTTPLGLVSTKPPNVGPTLPTSCSAWVYLGGTPYTSNTSAIDAAQSIHQRGSWSYFDAAVSPLTTISANTAAIVETAQSLSTFIPPTALAASLMVRQIAQAGSGNVDTQAAIRVVSGSNYTAPRMYNGAASIGITAAFTQQFGVTIPIISTPSVSFLNVINTGTSAAMAIDVTGYQNPNGDA